MYIERSRCNFFTTMETARLRRRRRKRDFLKCWAREWELRWRTLQAMGGQACSLPMTMRGICFFARRETASGRSARKPKWRTTETGEIFLAWARILDDIDGDGRPDLVM